MIPAKRIKTPDPEFATVTFIRSGVMAFGVTAMLWDRESLIGELSPRKYIQYKAAPGKHLFMAKSENWSYLNANLIAGKHYIVVVDIYPNGYGARFELTPALPFEDKVKKTDIDGWFVNLEGEKPLSEYVDAYKMPYLAETRRAAKAYDDGKVDCPTLNPGDDWPHLSASPAEPSK
jgi:hypothetical protein